MVYEWEGAKLMVVKYARWPLSQVNSSDHQFIINIHSCQKLMKIIDRKLCSEDWTHKHTGRDELIKSYRSTWAHRNHKSVWVCDYWLLLKGICQQMLRNKHSYTFNTCYRPVWMESFTILYFVHSHCSCVPYFALLYELWILAVWDRAKIKNRNLNAKYGTQEQ